MSAALKLPDLPPPPEPDQAGPAPLPRVGRLLSIVRKLVSYGNALIITLQQGRSAHRRTMATLAFGTKELALIIARIKCGLQRAALLEDRLNVYVARGRDVPELSEPLRLPREPKEAPSADAPARAARNKLLVLLPTAEEIADQVRRRRLGTVIGDICRDLGLASGSMERALWDELFDAVMTGGIDITRFIRDKTPVFGDDEAAVGIALAAWPGPEAQLAIAGSAQPP